MVPDAMDHILDQNVAGPSLMPCGGEQARADASGSLLSNQPIGSQMENIIKAQPGGQTGTNASNTFSGAHGNPAIGSLMENIIKAQPEGETGGVDGSSMFSGLLSNPAFGSLMENVTASMAQGTSASNAPPESGQEGEAVSRMLKKVLPVVEQALAAGASSGQPSSKLDNAGKAAERK